MSFSELVHSRRSVRKFDAEHSFDHSSVERALELTQFSPNSSNMQLWEFHRVIDPTLIEQMGPLCMKQNAAATANELVLFVTTPNKWQSRAQLNAKQVRENFSGREELPVAKRAFSYYEKLIPALYNNDALGIRGVARKLYSWWLGRKKPMVREVSKSDVRVTLHKSASLAAMTFMYAMKEQGYDTCPMEGFDSKRVKSLLNLPKNVEICMIVSCGKALQEGIYGGRHRVDLASIVKTY